MMNKTEQILFDAVKVQNDEMACSIIGLFASPDKEFEPDAQIPDLNFCDEYGFSLLHYAIKRNLVETVSRLLEKGAAVDTRDKNGCTPLVLAMNRLPERQINDSDIFSVTRTGVFKIIENLVKFNADIYAVDPGKYSDGYTCLHLAVSQNQCLVLNSLLVKQQDPAKCLEVIDNLGQTPFHLACMKGDVFIVGAMLDMKINPNFQSPIHGYTPLHFAVDGNQAQIISMLIKAGADPLIGALSKNSYTPLVMAKKLKKMEAVAVLENPFGNLKETVLLSSGNPKKESFILAKPFIASPIHTVKSLDPQNKQMKTSSNTPKSISLTCNHLTIVFCEKRESLGWRLEVINNEKITHDEFSVTFSVDESITKIQKYLQENNVADLIEFLAVKGVSAKKISQYLKEEIKVQDNMSTLR